MRRSTPQPRWRGGSSTAWCPHSALDAAVAQLADTIAAHSREVVALGKRAFYEQIDRGIADAYAHTGEAMACNLLLPDAAEGIDAFLGKRAPDWKS